MISPCVEYLDKIASSNALAQRPGSLEGKVVGLIPNWRPAAVHLLTAIHAGVRGPFDMLAGKPHASPVDHSLGLALPQLRIPS